MRRIVGAVQPPPGWLRFPVGWDQRAVRSSPYRPTTNFRDSLAIVGRSSTARPGWLRFPVGWTAGERSCLQPTTKFWRFLAMIIVPWTSTSPPGLGCYDFLSDGPAGERSALQPTTRVKCGDDVGGLRPPARACYVILGWTGGRTASAGGRSYGLHCCFVWRPIAGRPYGLAGQYGFRISWGLHRKGVSDEDHSTG